MKNILSLLLLLWLQLCLQNVAHAQKPKNAAKWPVPVPVRVPVPCELTRDTNLAWKKRVCREIEVYELKNAPLRSNNANSFAAILLSGIKSGALKAYSNHDTTFSTPLSLAAIDTLTQCDANNLSILARTYLNNVSKHSGDTTIKDTAFIASCTYPQQVEFYHIKEKWTFDRRGGQMLVQIEAVAPAAYVNGKKMPLFWLHYPDIRNYLSNYKIDNLQNDKDSYSWDVYFESRKFSSKVTSASDPFFEELHTYKISEKLEK